MKACTCKTIVRQHEHELSCPQWVAPWVRQLRKEREKAGGRLIAVKEVN